MAWAGRPPANSAALPESLRCYKTFGEARVATASGVSWDNGPTQRVW